MTLRNSGGEWLGWLTEGWELLIRLPGPALRFSPGYNMARFQRSRERERESSVGSQSIHER
jgi:hypothetical protein